MAQGTIRYWAAARDVAGTEQETYDAATLADALTAARGRRSEATGPAGLSPFDRVMSVCSYVVDGQPVGSQDPAAVQLRDGGTVEVLPPFAGG